MHKVLNFLPWLSVGSLHSLNFQLRSFAGMAALPLFLRCWGSLLLWGHFPPFLGPPAPSRARQHQEI